MDAITIKPIDLLNTLAELGSASAMGQAELVFTLDELAQLGKDLEGVTVGELRAVLGDRLTTEADRCG